MTEQFTAGLSDAFETAKSAALAAIAADYKAACDLAAETRDKRIAEAEAAIIKSVQDIVAAVTSPTFLAAIKKEAVKIEVDVGDILRKTPVPVVDPTAIGASLAPAQPVVTEQAPNPPVAAAL